MKQARKDYPGLIFQETFNSEYEVRRNGNPTYENLSFFKGETIIGSGGYLIYNVINSGYSTIRMKVTLNLIPSYTYFFRLDDLTKYLRILDGALSPIGLGSFSYYIDGVKSATLTTGEHDIVFITSTPISEFIRFFNYLEGGVNSLIANCNFIEIYNRELSAAEIHNLRHGLEQIDIPNFNGAKLKIFESTYANSFANVSAQRTNLSIDIATESLKGVVTIDISPIGFEYNSAPSGFSVGDKVNISFEMKASRSTSLKYIGAISQTVGSSLLTTIKNQNIGSVFNTFEFELTLLSLSAFYIAISSSDIDVDDEIFIRNIVFKKVQSKLLVDYTSSKGVVENRIKPNPLGLGKQRVVGVFDGESYASLVSPIILVGDFEISFLYKNEAVNSLEAILSGNSYKNGLQVAAVGSYLYFKLNNNTTILTGDISGIKNIFLKREGTNLNYKILDVEGNILADSNQVIGTENFPIYDIGYRSYGDTYYLNGALSKLNINGTIYKLDGTDTGIINNGVTFQDLTPLPTLTNILYKQLGTYWSAYFNGVNSKVDLGYDPIGVGDITIMGWIKPFSYGQNDVGNVLNNGEFLLMTRGSSYKRLQWVSRGSSYSFFGSNSLNLNSWSFFMITRNGAISNNYMGSISQPLSISGVEDQVIAEPIGDGNTLLLGNRSEGDQTLNALIPFLRIYQGILPIELGEQFRTSTLKMIK